MHTCSEVSSLSFKRLLWPVALLVSITIQPAPARGADLAELCALGEALSVREALEEGASVDARDELGMTPLHHAVKAGLTAPLSSHLDVVRLLVEHGADVDAADAGGVTPLAFSLGKGAAFGALTELLLELGADPDRAVGGAHPLHMAALGGSARQLEALLEFGADLSLPDAQGLTPLHSVFLAEHPSSEKVLLLLEAGADVNARCSLWDDEDVTPLMVAAALSTPENVAILLDNGALSGARSAARLRAFDFAELWGREQNAWLLR